MYTYIKSKYISISFAQLTRPPSQNKQSVLVATRSITMSHSIVTSCHELFPLPTCKVVHLFFLFHEKLVSYFSDLNASSGFQ